MFLGLLSNIGKLTCEALREAVEDALSLALFTVQIILVHLQKERLE